MIEFNKRLSKATQVYGNQGYLCVLESDDREELLDQQEASKLAIKYANEATSQSMAINSGPEILALDADRKEITAPTGKAAESYRAYWRLVRRL